MYFISKAFNSIVEKYLNTYFYTESEAGTRSSIGVNIRGLNGTFTERNLFVEKYALDGLFPDFPFVVSFGTLGELKLTAGIRKPVKFEGKNLVLELTPKSEEPWDGEMDRDKIYRMKMNELEFRRLLVDQIEEIRRKEQKKNILSKIPVIKSLMKHFANTIEIFLENVEIRYRSNNLVGPTPFVLVMLCEKFGFTNCSREPYRFIEDSDLEVREKDILLQGLKIFRLGKPCILNHVDVSMQLVVHSSKSGEVDLTHPLFILNTKIEKIDVRITNEEYKRIMTLIEYIGTFSSRDKYRKYKPSRQLLEEVSSKIFNKKNGSNVDDLSEEEKKELLTKWTRSWFNFGISSMNHTSKQDYERKIKVSLGDCREYMKLYKKQYLVGNKERYEKEVSLRLVPWIDEREVSDQLNTKNTIEEDEMMKDIVARTELQTLIMWQGLVLGEIDCQNEKWLRVRKKKGFLKNLLSKKKYEKGDLEMGGLGPVLTDEEKILCHRYWIRRSKEMKSMRRWDVTLDDLMDTLSIRQVQTEGPELEETEGEGPNRPELEETEGEGPNRQIPEETSLEKKTGPNQISNVERSIFHVEILKFGVTIISDDLIASIEIDDVLFDAKKMLYGWDLDLVVGSFKIFDLSPFPNLSIPQQVSPCNRRETVRKSNQTPVFCVYQKQADNTDVKKSQKVRDSRALHFNATLRPRFEMKNTIEVDLGPIVWDFRVSLIKRIHEFFLCDEIPNFQEFEVILKQKRKIKNATPQQKEEKKKKKKVVANEIIVRSKSLLLVGEEREILRGNEITVNINKEKQVLGVDFKVRDVKGTIYLPSVRELYSWFLDYLRNTVLSSVELGRKMGIGKNKKKKGGIGSKDKKENQVDVSIEIEKGYDVFYPEFELESDIGISMKGERFFFSTNVEKIEEEIPSADLSVHSVFPLLFNFQSNTFALMNQKTKDKVHEYSKNVSFSFLIALARPQNKRYPKARLEVRFGSPFVVDLSPEPFKYLHILIIRHITTIISGLTYTKWGVDKLKDGSLDKKKKKKSNDVPVFQLRMYGGDTRVNMLSEDEKRKVNLKLCEFCVDLAFWKKAFVCSIRLGEFGVDLEDVVSVSSEMRLLGVLQNTKREFQFIQYITKELNGKKPKVKKKDNTEEKKQNGYITISLDFPGPRIKLTNQIELVLPENNRFECSSQAGSNIIDLNIPRLEIKTCKRPDAFILHPISFKSTGKLEVGEKNSITFDSRLKNVDENVKNVTVNLFSSDFHPIIVFGLDCVRKLRKEKKESGSSNALEDKSPIQESKNVSDSAAPPSKEEQVDENESKIIEDPTYFLKNTEYEVHLSFVSEDGIVLKVVDDHKRSPIPLYRLRFIKIPLNVMKFDARVFLFPNIHQLSEKSTGSKIMLDQFKMEYKQAFAADYFNLENYDFEPILEQKGDHQYHFLLEWKKERDDEPVRNRRYENLDDEEDEGEESDDFSGVEPENMESNVDEKYSNEDVKNKIDNILLRNERGVWDLDVVSENPNMKINVTHMMLDTLVRFYHSWVLEMRKKVLKPSTTENTIISHPVEDNFSQYSIENHTGIEMEYKVNTFKNEKSIDRAVDRFTVKPTNQATCFMELYYGVEKALVNIKRVGEFVIGSPRDKFCFVVSINRGEKPGRKSIIIHRGFTLKNETSRTWNVIEGGDTGSPCVLDPGETHYLSNPCFGSTKITTEIPREEVYVINKPILGSVDDAMNQQRKITTRERIEEEKKLGYLVTKKDASFDISPLVGRVERRKLSISAPLKISNLLPAPLEDIEVYQNKVGGDPVYTIKRLESGEKIEVYQLDLSSDYYLTAKLEEYPICENRVLLQRIKEKKEVDEDADHLVLKKFSKTNSKLKLKLDYLHFEGEHLEEILFYVDFWVMDKTQIGSISSTKEHEEEETEGEGEEEELVFREVEGRFVFPLGGAKKGGENIGMYSEFSKNCDEFLVKDSGIESVGTIILGKSVDSPQMIVTKKLIKKKVVRREFSVIVKPLDGKYWRTRSVKISYRYVLVNRLEDGWNVRLCESTCETGRFPKHTTIVPSGRAGAFSFYLDEELNIFGFLTLSVQTGKKKKKILRTDFCSPFRIDRMSEFIRYLGQGTSGIEGGLSIVVRTREDNGVIFVEVKETESPPFILKNETYFAFDVHQIYPKDEAMGAAEINVEKKKEGMEDPRGIEKMKKKRVGIMGVISGVGDVSGHASAASSATSSLTSRGVQVSGQTMSTAVWGALSDEREFGFRRGVLKDIEKAKIGENCVELGMKSTSPFDLEFGYVKRKQIVVSLRKEQDNERLEEEGVIDGAIDGRKKYVIDVDKSGLEMEMRSGDVIRGSILTRTKFKGRCREVTFLFQPDDEKEEEENYDESGVKDPMDHTQRNKIRIGLQIPRIEISFINHVPEEVLCVSLFDLSLSLGKNRQSFVWSSVELGDIQVDNHSATLDEYGVLLSSVCVHDLKESNNNDNTDSDNNNDNIVVEGDLGRNEKVLKTLIYWKVQEKQFFHFPLFYVYVGDLRVQVDRKSLENIMEYVSDGMVYFEGLLQPKEKEEKLKKKISMMKSDDEAIIPKFGKFVHFERFEISRIKTKVSVDLQYSNDNATRRSEMVEKLLSKFPVNLLISVSHAISYVKSKFENVHLESSRFVMEYPFLPFRSIQRETIKHFKGEFSSMVLNAIKNLKRMPRLEKKKGMMRIAYGYHPNVNKLPPMKIRLRRHFGIDGKVKMISNEDEVSLKNCILKKVFEGKYKREECRKFLHFQKNSTVVIVTTSNLVVYLKMKIESGFDSYEGIRGSQSASINVWEVSGVEEVWCHHTSDFSNECGLVDVKGGKAVSLGLKEPLMVKKSRWWRRGWSTGWSTEKIEVREVLVEESSEDELAAAEEFVDLVKVFGTSIGDGCRMYV